MRMTPLPRRRPPPFPRAVRLLPLVLVPALASCGVETGRATVGEAVRDTLPDGTPRLSYPALDAPPTDTLVPDLRIGRVDGAPEYVLGDVRAVDVGEDGTIYVLDQQASEVRSFGPDGTFAGTLARGGEGPGEIGQAEGMQVGPGDTVWVRDHRRWHFHGYPLDGGDAVTRPLAQMAFGYVWSGVIDRDGRLWATTSQRVDAREEPPIPSESGVRTYRHRSYLKWLDRGAEAPDSMLLGEDDGWTLVIAMGNGARFSPLPFATRRELAVDPSGEAVWVAGTEAKRFVRMELPGGDTTLVVEVAHERAPVTDADRADWVERQEASLPEGVQLPPDAAQHFPEAKPAFENLRVDREGRLWVRRLDDGPDDPRPVYDVFDREGDHLGSLALGAPVSQWFPIRVRDGALYTVVRDELDVPSVVRFPLPDWLGGSGATALAGG